MRLTDVTVDVYSLIRFIYQLIEMDVLWTISGYSLHLFKYCYNKLQQRSLIKTTTFCRSISIYLIMVFIHESFLKPLLGRSKTFYVLWNFWLDDIGPYSGSIVLFRLVIVLEPLWRMLEHTLNRFELVQIIFVECYFG